MNAGHFLTLDEVLNTLQDLYAADALMLVGDRAASPLPWEGSRTLEPAGAGAAVQAWAAAVGHGEVMPPPPYQDAHLIPLASAGPEPAALVLLSRQAGCFAGADDAQDARRRQAAPFLEIVRLRLAQEGARRALDEAQADEQAITAFVQTLGRSPSSQAVVDTLHQSLLGEHISLCALLLYNPQSDDHLSRQFDHLEIQGRWSRVHGSGAGLGTRIYTAQYADNLNRLEAERVLLFHDLSNEAATAGFDALARGYLRADSVVSLALIAIGSGSQRLGILTLGTNAPHHFSPRELRQYRLVANIISLNATARLLRQQRDQVDQARAALLDSINDGVVMVVAASSSDQVIATNEVFSNWFGVHEAQAINQPLLKLLERMQLPEDIRAELRTAWARITPEEMETYHGAFALVSDEGRPLYLEWHSAPVYAPGSFSGSTDASRSERYKIPKIVGRLYTFHDVSAARAAEQVRSAFLSRVSHELRTPLTSISGFAEFILDVEGERLPNRTREYVEIIFQKARHLSAIFTDMIEMTRADAGEMRLNRALHHLPDAILDAAAGLEMQYRARGQTLLLDLDDDLPPANVDADRVVQVLTNLIGNAIKYAPENSTISVSAHLATEIAQLGEDAPRDVVLPAAFIRIEDQGGGLTALDAERVFTAFYRTESAHQQQIAGAGLGLAVTRSIVEVHRGRVWVVPVPRASGGWFYLTIPVVLEE